MRKQIFKYALYGLLGFGALQLPFSYIIGGQGLHFSLFDFMAPGLGGLVGSIGGAITVVTIKLFNTIVHGAVFDTAAIIRLFPLAFATLYFGLRKYRWTMAVIPLLSMVLFISHPEGRAAWYYSLYWLIPVASLFVKNSLFFRSLGSTFTAHAVGGVGFLYAFNLPAEAWIALIPIVFIERMMFTVGTMAFYLAATTVRSLVAQYRATSVPASALPGTAIQLTKNRAW